MVDNLYSQDCCIMCTDANCCIRSATLGQIGSRSGACARIPIRPAPRCRRHRGSERILASAAPLRTIGAGWPGTVSASELTCHGTPQLRPGRPPRVSRRYLPSICLGFPRCWNPEPIRGLDRDSKGNASPEARRAAPAGHDAIGSRICGRY